MIDRTWMDEKCTDCKWYEDRQYDHKPSCKEKEVTEVCVCWTAKEKA